MDPNLTIYFFSAFIVALHDFNSTTQCSHSVPTLRPYSSFRSPCATKLLMPHRFVHDRPAAASSSSACNVEHGGAVMGALKNMSPPPQGQPALGFPL